MQHLSEKLYGKKITEEDYVETIKNKLAGNVNKKSSSEEPENMIDQDMEDWELENYNPQENENDDAGEKVDNYSDTWQKAMDAQSRKNMAPDVEWNRTIYGKTRETECTKLDPYMFITTRDAKDRLMDDIGIHTILECEMRKLMFNTNQEEKTFNSIKKWAKTIDNCDIVFSKCRFYNCKIRVKKKQTMNIKDLSGSGYDLEIEKRLVLYHDMKNGFFVCNHFVLIDKEKHEIEVKEKRIFADDYLKVREDKTAQKNYKYKWFGYTYLQYINEF